ncbi:uncharacterized protein LOC126224414 [Schistocerca nitens]|uniref:uncharacterized protein LOC126224414 n=1 Tax=Schistocerca nitens TaxID=7011 RepID=UPI002117E6CC|nr:uncharacterized protein LOC126224414 [Schistocerca nitens]
MEVEKTGSALVAFWLQRMAQSGTVLKTPAHKARAITTPPSHTHISVSPENAENQATAESEVPSEPYQAMLLDLVRGGFQPRLPTSLPPPVQQQQPSPLPRRQPVPLMPLAQLHPGAPQVVAPAPAVPLQSPPPSELMDVDPSAGPPSQAVAVQPVLQPLFLGTPKESDTAAPCPAPTQQPSTQRQETLPLFVGPDAPSRPVPEAAPVVTGVHPDLGFQSVFPEAPRSQCWESFELLWRQLGCAVDIWRASTARPRPQCGVSERQPASPQSQQRAAVPGRSEHSSPRSSEKTRA